MWLGSTGFDWFWIGFYRVLPGFTGFYRVLPGWCCAVMKDAGVDAEARRWFTAPLPTTGPRPTETQPPTDTTQTLPPRCFYLVLLLFRAVGGAYFGAYLIGRRWRRGQTPKRRRRWRWRWKGRRSLKAQRRNPNKPTKRLHCEGSGR